jgi:hypothetical protein
MPGPWNDRSVPFGKYGRSSVFVGAALPRAVGIAEVDRQPGGFGDRSVQGHLLALVPGQRPAQDLGDVGDLGGHRRGEGGGGAVAGQVSQHTQEIVVLVLNGHETIAESSVPDVLRATCPSRVTGVACEIRPRGCPKIGVANPTSSGRLIVDADLDTLATALYVRVYDLLKSEPHWAPWRPSFGIAPKLAECALWPLQLQKSQFLVLPTSLDFRTGGFRAG